MGPLGQLRYDLRQLVKHRTATNASEVNCFFRHSYGINHKYCQRHNGPKGWGHITISNTNLDQISSSESRLKNQLLNQTSASPINLKFKISTKHSFRIATKIQLHNPYKTSASKCWTNSSFKILPELQLQNLDQPLCSKSEQKFSFRTKRQLPNL